MGRENPATASVDDAAAYLGVSVASVRRMVKNGTLTCLDLGVRRLRFSWAELERIASPS